MLPKNINAYTICGHPSMLKPLWLKISRLQSYLTKPVISQNFLESLGLVEKFRLLLFLIIYISALHSCLSAEKWQNCHIVCGLCLHF